jgi:ribosomal protein S18 acetylase RimI-like enzyme
MVALTIRSATSGDVAAVLSLWRIAGAPPTVGETAEGLSALLANDREALLIAEYEEIPAGALIAAWNGWRGSLYRLAVDPGERRRGVGTALVREGERRLRARGARRLTAIVADDDPSALAFWSSVGYQPQQHRARFIRELDE